MSKWYELPPDGTNNTWVMPVDGGWLVSHMIGRDPLTKSIQFISDPTHVSFDVGSTNPIDTPTPPVDPPTDIPPSVTEEVVFNGTWAPGWAQNSWGVINDSFQDGGSSVIRADVDGWSALNFHLRNGKMFSTLDTRGVKFSIKGEGTGDQASSIRVCFVDGTNVLGSVLLSDLLPNGLSTTDYNRVEVTFKDVGLDAAFVTNVWFQGSASGNRDAILVRDIALMKYDIPLTVPDVQIPTPNVQVVPTSFDMFISQGKIFKGGAVWNGRGVNLHDTRGNNACAYMKPNVGEVTRRLDFLSSNGVTFVRLCLESYVTANGRTHYASVLHDPDYLDDVVRIVNHAGQLGLTLMLTPWVDASYPGSQGAPTPYLKQVWRVLASVFRDAGHVIFGILNEPTGNYDGSLNEERRAGYEDILRAIRSVENANMRHIVTVQGIGGWARHMDYWVSNPMDDNMVAYEVHVYNPEADFDKLFINPSSTLPMIIGEFGPDGTYMNLQDSQALITAAQSLSIPHLGWAFHPKSHPSMLVNNGDNCGIGMDLSAMTDWGNLLFSSFK